MGAPGRASLHRAGAADHRAARAGAKIDWPLPSPKGRYARSSVIELLPDPLSPLFATLAVPAWNDAYRELARTIGLGRLMPEQFLVTINDYAYYDTGGFGAWQTMLTMPRAMWRGWDRCASAGAGG